MYIHDDGSVTGSVNHAVLDAYRKAKAEGGDLSEFAPYLASESPEAKLAEGAQVSLPGGREASPEAQAADERVAADARAVQESSDQRSADLAAVTAANQPQATRSPDQAQTQAAEATGQASSTPDEGEDNRSLADLQAEAESRGLPKYGTKAEIAERLRTAQEG